MEVHLFVCVSSKCFLKEFMKSSKSEDFTQAPHALSCPPPYPSMPSSALFSMGSMLMFVERSDIISSFVFSLAIMIILFGFSNSNSFDSMLDSASLLSEYLKKIIWSSFISMLFFRASYFSFTFRYFLNRNLPFEDVWLSIS